MTSETILTDEQIGKAYESMPRIYHYKTFSRAIEQAVLQSEQVQAWKRDAERYRFLRGIGDDIQWENLLGIQWGTFNSTDSAVDTAMETRK